MGGPMSDRINDFAEYHRNLPHWQQPGALHFLTLNLYDRSLCDLTRPQIAPVVIDALRFFHGERYTLFDYTVMPDHAHLLMEPARDGEGWFPLSRITHSIKSWTANRINAVLGRQGQFWQEETYDHIVRDRNDLRLLTDYIWMNPVRARLVERPHDWPWWGRGDGR